MTNKEAITILENLKIQGNTFFSQRFAIDLAIKALKERPHGKWIKHIDDLYPEDSTEECSSCHEEQRLVGNDDNFCPNCGAKMTKEVNDE